MELSNEFVVPVAIDEAWGLLTDVERIAPCMPGAELQEIEGDEYRGIVKVKVGPITAQYKGKATFVEKDDGAHRAVLRAEGRDTRGQGNANATITATLVPEESGTRVTVVTDLAITGRAAQFGRGVMADVSDKIVGQFSSCLAKKLGPGAAKADEAAPAAEAADKSASAGTSAAAGSATAAASAGKAPEVGSAGVATATATPASATSTNGSGPKLAAAPEPTRSEVDAIDLLDTAGAPVLKRLAPVVLGLIALFIIFRVIKGRKS